MKFLLPLIIALLTGVASLPEATRQRMAVREVAGKAAAGDPKALYDLAMLHDMGYDSIPVDSLRSTALYRLSAEKGYAPAQNYLGFRYFNGEAVREDIDSALYWLAKAAGNGDAKAANNLGYLLISGEKVARDYPQAIRWLSQAAEAGLPAGMSQLGDIYRQGLGCVPDTARAEELYNNAIRKGLHDAELKLLAMKGRSWATLPADSALELGRYHYTHAAPLIGVTLFENIIAADSAGASATKALALLGDAYSRGAGVAYDHDRSISLYLEAAMRGEPSAQFVIAELLDIFPDALKPTDPELTDPASDMDRRFPIASRSTGITDPELSDPQYWYNLAASQGVTDAETATRLLLE